MVAVGTAWVAVGVAVGSEPVWGVDVGEAVGITVGVLVPRLLVGVSLVSRVAWVVAVSAGETVDDGPGLASVGGAMTISNVKAVKATNSTALKNRKMRRPAGSGDGTTGAGATTGAPQCGQKA